MTKKILLVILSVLCAASLAACSATPANKSASATASSTLAAVSPSAAATASTPSTQTASASTSASASDVSAASPAGSDEDPGYTLENIIKEDSLNKNYQNTPVPGESIEVTIVRNTLTFNVTLDKNIKPEDFTADLQAKYKLDLQNQIDMLSQEYDGLMDCTFVYNLMNKSGTQLMSLTQVFKYQGN
ncbi:MAG: hypothetical protein WCP73_04110 [Eubacteriales bacterium]